MNSKGIALVMVLAFILAVVIMANVALILIRSQTRFTHHQFSRIRAYYAAQAGIDYALEQIRTGGWTPDPAVHKFYCINNDGTMTCTDGNVVDSALLPYRVEIDIWPKNQDANPQLAGVTQIEATVDYTYTPI